MIVRLLVNMINIMTIMITVILNHLAANNHDIDYDNDNQAANIFMIIIKWKKLRYKLFMKLYICILTKVFGKKTLSSFGEQGKPTMVRENCKYLN